MIPKGIGPLPPMLVRLEVVLSHRLAGEAEETPSEGRKCRKTPAAIRGVR